MTQYYVIKKKVAGDYLLSSKNEIIEQSYDLSVCLDKFTTEVKNRKSNSDTFVICSKKSNERYIQILHER